MRDSPNSHLALVVTHPWKVIGICLLAVVVVGSFMRHVAPSVSYKDMLGEDYPLLKDYDHIQTEYTNDDNLLVLIEARNGDAFTRDILSGVRELTRELWKTPHSIRVDAITNFQHTEADGDVLQVGDLVGEEASLTPSALARIKQVALTEPVLLNRAVNENGNVLAINVSFAFPNLSIEEKLGADAFVQEAAASFRESHPQANAYVAGLVALDAMVRISEQSYHPFRSKVTTDFGAKLPPVSV